jgi:hypothetical protein
MLLHHPVHHHPVHQHPHHVPVPVPVAMAMAMPVTVTVTVAVPMTVSEPPVALSKHSLPKSSSTHHPPTPKPSKLPNPSKPSKSSTSPTNPHHPMPKSFAPMLHHPHPLPHQPAHLSTPTFLALSFLASSFSTSPFPARAFFQPPPPKRHELRHHISPHHLPLHPDLPTSAAPFLPPTAAFLLLATSFLPHTFLRSFTSPRTAADKNLQNLLLLEQLACNCNVFRSFDLHKVAFAINIRQSKLLRAFTPVQLPDLLPKLFNGRSRFHMEAPNVAGFGAYSFDSEWHV